MVCPWRHTDFGCTREDHPPVRWQTEDGVAQKANMVKWKLYISRDSMYKSPLLCGFHWRWPSIVPVFIYFLSILSDITYVGLLVSTFFQSGKIITLLQPACDLVDVKLYYFFLLYFNSANQCRAFVSGYINKSPLLCGFHFRIEYRMDFITMILQYLCSEYICSLISLFETCAFVHLFFCRCILNTPSGLWNEENHVCFRHYIDIKVTFLST